MDLWEADMEQLYRLGRFLMMVFARHALFWGFTFGLIWLLVNLMGLVTGIHPTDFPPFVKMLSVIYSAWIVGGLVDAILPNDW